MHQINEACSAAGLSEYTDDEVQPLAVRLALADALEAFYIYVKLGVEGIGEIQLGLSLLEYVAYCLLRI